MTISNKLSELRKMNNYSLEEVSKKTGIDIETLKEYELGNKEVLVEHLNKLAIIYDTNVDDLKKYPFRDEPEHEDLKLTGCPLGNGKTKKETKLYIGLTSILFLVSVVIYLIVGFVGNYWHPGWLVFIAAAAVDSVIAAACYKKFSNVGGAVISATVFTYLMIGFLVPNGWHPYWIIFFVIPIYFVIVRLVETYGHNKK